MGKHDARRPLPDPDAVAAIEAVEPWRDADDSNDRVLTPVQTSFRRRLALVAIFLGLCVLAAKAVVEWTSPNPVLNGAELAGLVAVGLGVFVLLDVEYRNRTEGNDADDNE